MGTDQYKVAPAEFVEPSTLGKSTAGLSVESAATPATTTPAAGTPATGTPGTKTRKVEPEAVAAAAEPELTMEPTPKALEKAAKKHKDYEEGLVRLGKIREGVKADPLSSSVPELGRKKVEEEYGKIVKKYGDEGPLGIAFPPLGEPPESIVKAGEPPEVVAGSAATRLFAGYGDYAAPAKMEEADDTWLDADWAYQDFGKLGETFDWVSVPLATKYQIAVNDRAESLITVLDRMSRASGYATNPRYASTDQIEEFKQRRAALERELGRLRRNSESAEQFLEHMRKNAERAGLTKQYESVRKSLAQPEIASTATPTGALEEAPKAEQVPPAKSAAQIWTAVEGKGADSVPLLRALSGDPERLRDIARVYETAYGESLVDRIQAEHAEATYLKSTGAEPRYWGEDPVPVEALGKILALLSDAGVS
jgi:hypothetical protein